MATVRDLPELITEFNELARQYVREQTVEPAKALGRLAGFSAIASFVFVLTAIFLSVAALRFIVGVMPDGTIWSGFGYVLASLAVLASVGLVVWRASR